MKFRVKNKISDAQIKTIKTRFKDLLTQAGGPTTVAHRTGIAIGTLKSIQGDKTRVISPSVANQICLKFKGEIGKKFTREYLRPDITVAQWERFDHEFGKGEQTPSDIRRASR